MDNPTRSIADQVAALEAAREAAEDEVTTLKDALAKVRDYLTAVLDGRAEAQDFDPADVSDTPAMQQHAAAIVAETIAADPPRMSRDESKRRNDGIDKAVLSVLTENAGTDIRVASIAEFIKLVDGIAVTGREVSSALQGLRNRVGVGVRPGAKKGYWTVVAATPAQENGAPAAQDIAEPEAPSASDEDGASALEEAGVVAGGADPADYGWR
jgi:hypothetical protein